MGNDPVNGVDGTGEQDIVVEGVRLPPIWWFSSGPTEEDGQAVLQAQRNMESWHDWICGRVSFCNSEEEQSAEDVEENLKGRARPGKETKGRTTQWDVPEGDPDEDFDGIADPDTVTPQPNGTRTGQTHDGRDINVGPDSSGGRAVRIQKKPGSKRWDKYRYTEK